MIDHLTKKRGTTNRQGNKHPERTSGEFTPWTLSFLIDVVSSRPPTAHVHCARPNNSNESRIAREEPT